MHVKRMLDFWMNLILHIPTKSLSIMQNNMFQKHPKLIWIGSQDPLEKKVK